MANLHSDTLERRGKLAQKRSHVGQRFPLRIERAPQQRIQFSPIEPDAVFARALVQNQIVSNGRRPHRFQPAQAAQTFTSWLSVGQAVEERFELKEPIACASQLKQLPQFLSIEP